MSRHFNPHSVVVLTLATAVLAGAGTWRSPLVGAAPVAGHPPAQDAAAKTAASVLDGVFTAAQAEQGSKQFEQTCTACHNLADHTGGTFTTKWAGTTLNELYDLISNTMPQSDPGSLKPEEYANIIAFFLKTTGYPQGDRELPSTADDLKKIRVEPPAK